MAPGWDGGSTVVLDWDGESSAAQAGDKAEGAWWLQAAEHGTAPGHVVKCDSRICRTLKEVGSPWLGWVKVDVSRLS